MTAAKEAGHEGQDAKANHDSWQRTASSFGGAGTPGALEPTAEDGVGPAAPARRGARCGLAREPSAGPCRPTSSRAGSGDRRPRHVSAVQALSGDGCRQPLAVRRPLPPATTNSLHGCSADLQIDEFGNRIRFGPQPNPTAGERIVFVIEKWRAVEIALNPRPYRDDSNRVPRAETRLGHPTGCDRAALPVHDRVQAKVVLQRVGANQKVVATVSRPKDDAATGVLLARD